MTKIVIEAEDTKVGRPLELEDFRQTRMLRDLVKGKIAELKPRSERKDIEKKLDS